MSCRLPHFVPDPALIFHHKQADGSDFISYAGAAMVDLTNPSAWQWYKSIIQANVLAYGDTLAGWMAGMICVYHVRKITNASIILIG